MDRRLVVSERAFRLMAEDCRAHPDTETGGVLVGRQAAGDFIVPYVILAGDRARREVAGFEPDASYQQIVLDFLFQRFSSNYVGDYHRHPGSFDRPSLHDLVTARRIVTDPAWSVAAACFPILTIQAGQVRMRSYLMTQELQQFEEMNIEVVPDSDCRIQAVLLGEVPILNKREEVPSEPVPSHRGRGSRFLRQLHWL